MSLRASGYNQTVMNGQGTIISVFGSSRPRDGEGRLRAGARARPRAGRARISRVQRRIRRRDGGGFARRERIGRADAGGDGEVFQARGQWLGGRSFHRGHLAGAAVRADAGGRGICRVQGRHGHAGGAGGRLGNAEQGRDAGQTVCGAGRFLDADHRARARGGSRSQLALERSGRPAGARGAHACGCGRASGAETESGRQARRRAEYGDAPRRKSFWNSASCASCCGGRRPRRWVAARSKPCRSGPTASVWSASSRRLPRRWPGCGRAARWDSAGWPIRPAGSRGWTSPERCSNRANCWKWLRWRTPRAGCARHFARHRRSFRCSPSGPRRPARRRRTAWRRRFGGPSSPAARFATMPRRNCAGCAPASAARAKTFNPRCKVFCARAASRRAKTTSRSATIAT